MTDRPTVDTTSVDYNYNGLGQLDEVIWTDTLYHKYIYSYDANGNMTSKDYKIEDVLKTDWSYTWDVQDRMTSAVKDDKTGADDDLRVEVVENLLFLE